MQIIHDRINIEHKSWKTSMVRLVIINALNWLNEWQDPTQGPIRNSAFFMLQNMKQLGLGGCSPFKHGDLSTHPQLPHTKPSGMLGAGTPAFNWEKQKTSQNWQASGSGETLLQGITIDTHTHFLPKKIYLFLSSVFEGFACMYLSTLCVYSIHRGQERA